MDTEGKNNAQVLHVRDELPFVSIIVLNYNSRQYLTTCFKSLSNVNYPKSQYEVILPDNASSDGSVEFVRWEFPWVTILPYDKNYGFAEGNNSAVAAAKGEYIVFLNPDTEVDRNWLVKLVEAIQKEPTIACCGSKILFSDKRNVIQNTGHIMSLMGLGYPVAFQKDVETRLDNPKYILAPSGCSMLIKKETFLEVGGFDASYFMYGEDVDLGLRLWLYGYKVAYTPASIVYHETAGSFASKAITSFHVFHSEKNRLITLTKDLELANVIKGTAISLVYSLVKFFYYIRHGKLDFAAAMLKARIAFLRQLCSIIRKRRIVQRKRQLKDRRLHELGFLLSLRESVKEMPREYFRSRQRMKQSARVEKK